MNSLRSRLTWVAGAAITPVFVVASALAAVGPVGTANEPTPAPVRLMPGSETAREFDVVNKSDDPASLHVQVLDVADDDNGCVRPEQQDGDVTCGNGGGELGEWLELRFLQVDDSGVSNELWSGTFDELREGTYLLDEVAAGTTPRLRLEIALPGATTNDTMSDRVSFTLHWTYTGTAETTTTAVLGVEQAGDPSDHGPGSSPGSLAATGGAVSVVLLAVIAALLTAGGLLVALGRRRDRRPL